MTDRQILETILTAVTDIKKDITETKYDIKELMRKMDAVYGQTAGLSEFKTEVTNILDRHNLDIQLLKKIAAN